MAERLLIHTRADAALGHGHAVRSLALAMEACRRGLAVHFAADEATRAVLAGYGAEPELLIPAGTGAYRVIRDLPGGSEPAAVKAERAAGARVLLLDDPGPARSIAHVVVDAMLTPERAAALPHGAGVRYCYGLEYAPLRAEVAAHAGAARPGQGRRPRLLIALGGGFDPALPVQVACTLAEALPDADCELLLPDAGAAPGDPGRVAVSVAARDVGARIARADLVVTKLGITLLEAFAVGVPCLLLEPGPAHLEVAGALERHYRPWPAIELGLAAGLSLERLAAEARRLFADRATLAGQALRARALVDGAGAARVIEALLAA